MSGAREEGGVSTRSSQKLGRPGRLRVLLHNDDYTTQEFVVMVLQSVFHHPPAEAVRLMLEVHERGLAVAGLYPREIAESKAARVRELAREAEFPFLCTTAPEG